MSLLYKNDRNVRFVVFLGKPLWYSEEECEILIFGGESLEKYCRMLTGYFSHFVVLSVFLDK